MVEDESFSQDPNPKRKRGDSQRSPRLRFGLGKRGTWVMSSLPRLAVGSRQSQADSSCFTWGLLDVLARASLSVQAFRAQATFAPHDGARVVTGRAPRQLDAWLMSAALCGELFSHGAAGHDLALVEGRFSNA